MGLKEENAEEEPRNKVMKRFEDSWYGQMIVVRWRVLPGQEGDNFRQWKILLSLYPSIRTDLSGEKWENYPTKREFMNKK